MNTPLPPMKSLVVTIVALVCYSCMFCASASAYTTIKDVIYSDAMGREVQYAVVLPDSYATQTNKTFPVLYCLHGAGSPYDTWAVMLPLNRAIDGDYPAIIVTFAGGSRYIDNKNDPSIRYTTFFFEELVPFIETTYRAGGRQELRGVTGFSMGGFGAWHFMLLRPDFFSSVSSLSGAFAGAPSGHSEFELYSRLEAAYQNEIELPPMYLGCGLSDRYLSENRTMEDALSSRGFSVEYVESPGDHNWTYWRDTSPQIIAFHYKYMSAPVALWKGFPVDDTNHADTGDFLGQVYAGYQPWVWAYSLSKWMWSPTSTNEHGEWFWIATQ